MPWRLCWPGVSPGGMVWMSVDSLMDNGASLESLKPTNILFSWKKTSSLDEVLSICKLQKHFGANRCRYSDSNLSPSLVWYFKFTILVDLYGPLKLVLIFAASTASTLLCIKNTLKLKKRNSLKLCVRTTVIL